MLPQRPFSFPLMFDLRAALSAPSPQTASRHPIPTCTMADSYFLFLDRIESLKTTRRRGWVIRGVPDPESVADHSHRVAVACLAAPGV